MDYDDQDQYRAVLQRRLEELQQRYTFGEAAMRLALEQAELAARDGEVPVGAIVLNDREIIAAEQKRELFEQTFNCRLSLGRRAALKRA